MKTFAVVLLMGATTWAAEAQYKAPSQYFRKDFPAPTKAGQQPQQSPQQHRANGNPQAATPAPPAQPAQPKFKDVGTNAQFYFMTDTNHTYPWTKISSSVATNTKTGARVTLSPETAVQR